MRRDVHLKALKAASNVAFSVALIGCGAASEDAGNGGGAASDGTPASAAESDLNGKPKGKTKHGSVATTDTSCHDGGAPDATPPDCNALVAAAFPTEGNYPGTKQDVGAEVEACCVKLLASTDGVMTHRWDCCANLPKDANVGIACTPWGPPVPPPMRRARQLEVA
jgi:hypothetical protein